MASYGKKGGCSGFPKEDGLKGGKIDIAPTKPTPMAGTPKSQPIVGNKGGKGGFSDAGVIDGKIK